MIKALFSQDVKLRFVLSEAPTNPPTFMQGSCEVIVALFEHSTKLIVAFDEEAEPINPPNPAFPMVSAEPDSVITVIEDSFLHFINEGIKVLRI